MSIWWWSVLPPVQTAARLVMSSVPPMLRGHEVVDLEAVAAVAGADATVQVA